MSAGGYRKLKSGVPYERRRDEGEGEGSWAVGGEGHVSLKKIDFKGLCDYFTKY